MGDGWRFDFRKTHFDKCSPPDFYARVSILINLMYYFRFLIDDVINF